MNTELFGFVRKGNSILPDIVISKPEGLPDTGTCMCGKCAHRNGCCCRVAGIKFLLHTCMLNNLSCHNVNISNVLEDEDVFGSNITDARGVFFYFAVNRDSGSLQY